MMTTQYSPLSSLEKMLDFFQGLRQLLEDDKLFFSQNNIAGIEESNKKKSILLEELAQLVNEFNETSFANKNDTLIETLSKNSKNLQPGVRNSIHELAQKLEAEMVECYESLAVNNKIVFSNIQKLKEFWEKLSSFKLDGECVYDAKANTHAK